MRVTKLNERKSEYGLHSPPVSNGPLLGPDACHAFLGLNPKQSHAMNSKKSKAVRKSNPSTFAANLVLAGLVLGVPLGTKLILETARAASSQPIIATQPMAVPRHAH